MDTATVSAQKTILLSIVAAAAAKSKKKSRRKLWCKEWLSRRQERGSFTQIFSELQTENHRDFENYTRMSVPAFYDLLSKVEPYITKEDTRLRDSITPGARLKATLRFLACGGSYTSLQYSTRISKQSLSNIIPETCDAIYHVLKDEYLKIPSTPEEWKAVAKGFEKWHFPHCVGAVDGKHVTIRPPSNSGSYFYNYKATHSIVLLAVVNANYEFVYVDVGTNGRVSGGGVWANSSLLTHLEGGTLGLPDDEPLPGSQLSLPFVFVGDDAFPLKRYFMKPYPFKQQDDQERIYSYRLSRARHVVENAFGILASKFRIFQTAINLEPNKVEKIVLACTALHNYLRRNQEANYTPPGSLDMEDVIGGTVVPGEWRADRPMLPLERIRRNPTNEAKNIREEFKHYFNQEGAVPWQNHMCGLE